MILHTLLITLIPFVISTVTDDDPHFYVYPNKPQHFIDPKPERRSLLPFLKVRDLPMTGLVYLNRIKPLQEETINEDKDIEDNKIDSVISSIDSVISSIQEHEEDEDEEEEEEESLIDTFPRPSSPSFSISSTLSPIISSTLPSTSIPLPPPFPSTTKDISSHGPQFIQIDQSQSIHPQINRIQSAPTQAVSHPVIGSAFISQSLPLPYPGYPILSPIPQYQPTQFIQPSHPSQIHSLRDTTSGDELTVVAPTVPYRTPVGFAPSNVIVRPVNRPLRQILVNGNPAVGYPRESLPIRARGVPIHRSIQGNTNDSKLVSISVFRLKQ